MKKLILLLSLFLTIGVAYGDMMIAPKANKIALTTPSAMTVGDADQTMTCTSRGGTSWGASPPTNASYTSTATSYATIVSGKLHAVAAGTTTVTSADTGGTGWGPAVSVTSGNVTISAGGAWYYPSGGSVNFYPNNTTYATGTRAGNSVTPGVSGNITKISVKLGTDATPKTCTLTLWTGTTNQRCVSGITGTPSSWIETAVTSFAISNTDTVKVTYDCSAQFDAGTAGETGGLWESGITYGNECTTAFGATADYDYGVRVWVQ